MKTMDMFDGLRIPIHMVLFGNSIINDC